MSNEMKLIMENWDRYLLSELLVDSWGDLLSTIKAIIAVKRGETLTSTGLGLIGSVFGVGGAAVKKLIDENPREVIQKLGKVIGMGQAAVDIVSGSQSIADVIQSAASLPDSDRTKAGYLAMLDFDDSYLKILDDKLENDLLNYLLQKVEQAAESDIDLNSAEFNINKVFEDFIKQAFDREISGAPAMNPNLIMKKGKMSVAKKRLGQKFQKDIA